MEYVRKHRDDKFVTTERIRNYLVSESNYLTTKFKKKTISNRNEKNEVLMNNSACLGISRLELSKILMYTNWYDYVW